MGDGSSTFTIAEQTGRKRTLILRERALPYRPFTLSGSMRTTTTWYPGNPIASMQVLGNEEDSTTISGTWKDRFLRSVDDNGRAVQPDAVALLGVQGSGSQQVANVVELAKTVDSIRREGQLLEVTWDQQVRHGILKSFKQNWMRPEVLEWEIVFEWISQGEKEVPIAFSLEVDQQSMTADFNTLSDKLKEATTSNPFPLVEDFQRSLTTMTDTIESAVASVSDTTANITSAVLTPADAAKRTLAALETIKNEAFALENLVTSRVARSIISTDDIETISVGQTLTAESYVRGIKDSSRQLRTTAATKSDELSKRGGEQEILAVFTAHENTDLRDVSQRFYGTQEEWRRLLQYNGLTSSKLTAGMFILIPKLRTSGV